MYKYKNIVNLTIKDLLEARLHLGHKNNKLNIKLLPYIFGVRHNINIFNLDKIVISLRLVFKALTEIIKQRGNIFLLGTTSTLPMNDIFNYLLKKYSKSNKNETHLYINGFIGKKWIGGLFSNWKGILQFLKYIKTSNKKNTTRYQKYLNYLQGINSNNSKLIPDFVFSFNGDKVALNEITQLNIPIIGINDTDLDPDFFLYNLIGNDDSMEAVQFFCNFLENVIEEGKCLDNERFFYYCFKSLKSKLK